jgi:hypothetical protein
VGRSDASQTRKVWRDHEPSTLTVYYGVGTLLGGFGAFRRMVDGLTQHDGLEPYLNILVFHDSDRIIDRFRLAFDGFQSRVGESDADYSRESERNAGTPINPVRPLSRYRHSGQFADSYGLFCIFGGFIVSAFLISFGRF